MKLHHAAALALVGWYLMIPAWNREAGKIVDLPLSEWTIARSFDSAKACEDTKKALTKVVRQDPTKVPLNAMLLSNCVASDDPRLSK